MNELKIFFQKSYIDKLKDRISSMYPEESLSIINVSDVEEYDDMVEITVRYTNPWWLVRLGSEMQIVRTYF